MKTSQTGIDLIKRFEGCRLTAYKPVATETYYTIGYGHYGPDVKAGMQITQAQADAYLKADLEKFEAKVIKYDSKYKWRQNEFDALVSFAYNIGSIDQLTANGTRSRAVIAEKIVLYNKAGGKALAGLTRRRKAEQDLYLQAAGNSTEADTVRIVEYSLKADGAKSISANFKVKEFACKDGSDKILIDVNFVQNKLQAIRDYFGAAVTINSAYRTATYNKKVGGAVGSYHTKGQAFDIVVKGKTPAQVAKYAQTLGIKGIIQYNTFVHVDSRTVQYWARDTGTAVKVNSF